MFIHLLETQGPPVQELNSIQRYRWGSAVQRHNSNQQGTCDLFSTEIKLTNKKEELCPF